MRLEAPEDALAVLERGLDLPAPPRRRAPARRLATRGAPGRRTTSDAAELAQLAAEAAYAAMRPTRAVAYAESALAALGERSDRLQHAVLEARLGRYRMAAGDTAGATAALRRAAEVAPPEPTLERARILALLAQERMIAGAFRDAERSAVEALEIDAVDRPRGGARGDPRADDPRGRARLGRRAGVGAAAAARGGRPGAGGRASWRSGGGRSRTRRSCSSCSAGPARRWTSRSRAWPRPATSTSTPCTGTSSAATWPGILVDVGRWAEARELSLRALDWSPAGVPFVNAILNLVLVEIESEAGEEAGRLLGRILVELETGGDLQFAIPAYQATASYAMWSGDLADARRAAERGWARLRGTEDWVLVARMAATAMEVEAAIVAEALERRRIGDVAASRERASRILAEAEGAVARARSRGRRDRASPRRASPRPGPSTPG